VSANDSKEGYNSGFHNFEGRIDTAAEFTKRITMAIPANMEAMVLEAPGRTLVKKSLPIPVPGADQVLVKVLACGICRTDLHIIDGDLKDPKLPLIPGHEIIGHIERLGEGSIALREGEIVGIPWLGFTCGQCKYCLKHQENLCERALFTGYTIDGGFAQYVVAYSAYCFPIASKYANPEGAPLLCAGLIGYRSYGMIDSHAQKIGIYVFGAAAHILVQVAKQQGKSIFAFTRDGDRPAQEFALHLGAKWAGGSSEKSPEKLDAAIIFAPVGNLIPKALRDLDKGGVVICGGIHMSDIPSFPYRDLWEERMIRSVANLTRKNAEDFLSLASRLTIKTHVELYRLEKANEAIDNLKRGKIQGAAVLVMD
jgi:alcohol dehydrogenase, propanol-preferring